MAKESIKGADAPMAQPPAASFQSPIVGASPESAPPPAAAAPAQATGAVLLEMLPPHVRALVLKAMSEAEQAISTAAEKAVARALPSSDGMQYRPPLDIPFHLLGEVAIGNFIGRLDGGKEWRVAHATPLRGLPTEIVAAIRKVPGVNTGVIAPPAVKPARAA